MSAALPVEEQMPPETVPRFPAHPSGGIQEKCSPFGATPTPTPAPGIAPGVPEAVASLTNAADAMMAFGVPNKGKGGGFNITVCDDDSGMFIGVCVIGFKRLEGAELRANAPSLFSQAASRSATA